MSFYLEVFLKTKKEVVTMMVALAIIFGLLVVMAGVSLGKWANTPIGFSAKTDSDRFYESVIGG